MVCTGIVNNVCSIKPSPLQVVETSHFSFRHHNQTFTEMKFVSAALVVLITGLGHTLVVPAGTTPVPVSRLPAVNETSVAALLLEEGNTQSDQFTATGFGSSFKHGLQNAKHTLGKKIKHGAAQAKKQAGKVKVLKEVLGNIHQISKIQQGHIWRVKRDLVDDLLVKVFKALKQSGLVNSIVKMSLTDDEVRHGVVDLTVELLEADVIPWEEIFDALKTSGLAVDVIKQAVVDPETRQGVIDLVIELIPELLSSGVLNLKDILKCDKTGKMVAKPKPNAPSKSPPSKSPPSKNPLSKNPLSNEKSLLKNPSSNPLSKEAKNSQLTEFAISNTTQS